MSPHIPPEDVAEQFARLDADSQQAVATLIRRLAKLPPLAAVAPPPEWPELMTGTDLRKRLGLSSSTFFKHVKRGDFRHLEVRRPLGLKRYSRHRVDQFLGGHSTVALGSGSRRY